MTTKLHVTIHKSPYRSFVRTFDTDIYDEIFFKAEILIMFYGPSKSRVFHNS